MKYERTDAFKRDYKRLPKEEQEAFKDAVMNGFVPALDAHIDDPGKAKFPSRLRIKGVTGAPGIWEMTWSFKDPDGRATWEWIEIEDEPGIRWRRIGTHSIFKDP